MRSRFLREGVGETVDPVPIDLGRVHRLPVIADVKLVAFEDRVALPLQHRQDVFLHHRFGRIPRGIEDDRLHR